MKNHQAGLGVANSEPKQNAQLWSEYVRTFLSVVYVLASGQYHGVYFSIAGLALGLSGFGLVAIAIIAIGNRQPHAAIVIFLFALMPLSDLALYNIGIRGALNPVTISCLGAAFLFRVVSGIAARRGGSA